MEDDAVMLCLEHGKNELSADDKSSSQGQQLEPDKTV